MNRLLIVYAVVASAMLGLLLLRSNTESKDPASTQAPPPVDDRNLPQIVKGVDLDKSYDFAGEELPIQENFDVRERLDRELMVNSYWHSSTSLNIKKAYRYFPVIEPILKKHGIPDDFKYLAVAESNLSHATSPAGAKGLWQFMPTMADYYDLEVNREVDERFHVEKITDAACKYIQHLKDRFGSWTLAAAAYNMGETRMARDLEQQRADSYFDLNLNEETSRYVFRIIAIKEILKDPQRFGFYFDKSDGYQPLNDYKTITVTESIGNLGDFAEEHDTSYRLLKVYNPWLLSHTLTISSGNSYEIRVPK